MLPARDPTTDAADSAPPDVIVSRKPVELEYVVARIAQAH
jgi:hypothetical protein